MAVAAVTQRTSFARALVVVLACALLSFAAPAGAVTASDLERDWARIDNPPPTLDTRWIFHEILEAAAIGWAPERIDRALDLAIAAQDRVVGSPTFGNFRSTRGAAAPSDPNVAVFCLQCAVVTWDLHRAHLTAAGQAKLRSLMSTGW